MGLPKRCEFGHIYLGVVCPYCQKVKNENDLFEGLIEAITKEGN